MESNEKYSHELKGNLAVIGLHKHVLGGGTALEFTKELQKLASKNVDYIILDLSKVELMNSSGLGMLVSGLSSMKKNDIRLVLADVPEKVNNLLNMTHLDKVFEIYENVADAESKLA